MSETVSLPTSYQHFIYVSRYSRWIEEENRRETWEETVERYFKFFDTHLKEKQKYTLSPKLRKELKDAVLNLEVMPSMRALMTAGPALEKSNVAGYNCSFVAVNNVRAFWEGLSVLLCGTGLGFSVERQYIEKLPTIAEEFHETDTTIVVEDSKHGWVKSYKELISLLIGGQIPKWDMSKVRPAGARLKTFGGRASGPKPLEDLFRFTTNIFKKSAGRKLSSIECHDIMCMVGSVVVSGGVRRSAEISLSDLTDEKMRDAKTGAWWEQNSQRAMANNSVAYSEKPDIGIFMEEWLSLYKSKSGERGIFNRQAAKKTIEKLGDRRDASYDMSPNPCGEILLRDREFCNLSTVVIRPNDTQEELSRKIRLATILGTFQASLTYFPNISSEWKKNCEEEALLGVSLTGIMDNPMMFMKDHTKLGALLEKLKQVAIDTNKEFADKININRAAAITCVKPEGTCSQLCNTSSGIHARHSEYYIRTIRSDNKDPLCQMMIAMGFPHEPCVMKPEYTTIFSFPQSAVGSVVRKDMTAIEQLEMWLVYKQHWTEHNPSITVTIKENEWMEVGAWVYANFDEICGVSFLPEDMGSYRQSPYQECTKEEYEAFMLKMPIDIEWSMLQEYEKVDTTTSNQTLACGSGGCEIH